MGAGRRCPLRFSGEAPQDVDRARFVALGLAAAALLVINRVVALIVGLVRAEELRQALTIGVALGHFRGMDEYVTLDEHD